jgi:ubiquinone/menaquinone biosynthesis C-methylase UbiE
MAEREFLPALRFPALTRFFDPFVRLGMPEERFKRRLIEQARLAGAKRILDVGAGTGTLAIMVKGAAPDADVVALDADPDILEIAREKSERAGTEIRFVHGFSTALPFEDRSFDRVLSTLFFHHLTGEAKRATAAEIARVLKPDGELHVADLGRPSDPLMGALVTSVRVFDGFEQTRDNVNGALPEIFEAAGLEKASEHSRFRTAVGTVALYGAKRPRRRRRRG